VVAIMRAARLLSLSGPALVLCVAGAACGGPDEVPLNETPAGIVVTVQPVQLNLLRQVVTATGRITPHPESDWTIHASETSLIADLPVEEGAQVAVGDILVRFDVASRTSALQAAEYEMTEANARIEEARTRVADLTALFARGLTARVELDAAKSALAAAETTVTAAQAALNGLRAAETRDTIRARFPGIVLQRWHYQGDLVMATGQDPVLRVVDPTRLQVTLDVPATEVGKLMPGQRVTLSPLGFMPLTSTILAVLPPTGTDPTMHRVIVDLPADLPAPVHPETPALAIDTPVSGEVLVAEVLEALVVPTDAIQRASGVTFVMIADASGRVVRRDVRLGVATTTLTQVLGGLELGDIVITSALNELVEGDAVRYVR